MSEEICPECRDGKHVNCDGIAWSLLLDSPVECRCQNEFCVNQRKD